MKISLELLKKEFAQWRNTSKKNRIPPKLKSLIVNSPNHYSKSQILAATGISNSTLYRIKQQNNKNKILPVKNEKPTKFIALSSLLPNPNIAPNKKENQELQIGTNTGLQIKITCNSAEQTANLILLLNKGAI